MYALIVALHLIGFGVLVILVAPHGYQIGGAHPTYTVGVGLLAYTFGLRHAFDADHIAAVDNTTRTLLARRERSASERGWRGERPLSVGFWFSLGHSTIVFALCVLLGLGVRSLSGQLADDDSRLHTLTSIVGPSVSGLFLWILGMVNLVALIGIVAVFRDLRQGRFDEAELERRLDSRGLLNRVLGGLTRSVTRAWHIYPVGVLFGLGFDTATEVGLLVVAGGAATSGLPFWAILVLPILFAAGMCLMDTTDGVFMNVAYGWAFARPVRKIFYNLTITSLSVLVALVIGTIELDSVLVDRLSIRHGPLAAIAGIPLADAGYALVGLFVLVWAVALAVWRLGRVEERWI
ncbi:HoxN/HupN/NixA family nickel/cobalt transporter [Nocardioides sp. CBS4Y-1]|uniref:Nickel/cobalt efflux system n=2 Tax=Nocardioides acrostichi TaxID=2784339 RepID=A0A930V3I4_9ACTN|nr:HoxN/HupN/NixA family nickel/cobalt transporter [Nocardioides acrostichi]